MTTKKLKDAPPAPAPVQPLSALAQIIAALKAHWESFYATAIAPVLDWRTIILVGFGLVLLAIDLIVAKSFLVPLGIVLVTLGILHWYRKTAHPYLDLEAFCEKALEDPMASAVVIASVFGFMGIVMMFFLFAAVR